MTPAELEAIRARNAARTPKTWQPVAVEIFFGRKGFLEEVHDDVNALLAEVERLRRALEAAKISHDALCYLLGVKNGETCTCSAVEHNAAIDAALRGEV